MRHKCRVYIQEIRILIGIIKKPQKIYDWRRERKSLSSHRKAAVTPPKENICAIHRRRHHCHSFLLHVEI